MIKLALHLVNVAVQHGNALLKVTDLLVLGKQLALIGLNVIQEDCLFIFTASACGHCLLQSLQKFVLRMVKVLNQRAHAFNLSVQILGRLTFGSQILLHLTKIVLQTHFFVLNQCVGLLEVHDLELGLVLSILVLHRFILAVVELLIQTGDLLPRLLNVLLKSGIVALNCFKFLLQSSDLVSLEL